MKVKIFIKRLRKMPQEGKVYIIHPSQSRSLGPRKIWDYKTLTEADIKCGFKTGDVCIMTDFNGRIA